MYSFDEFPSSDSPHRTAIFVSGKSIKNNRNLLKSKELMPTITAVDPFERSDFESQIKFKKIDDDEDAVKCGEMKKDVSFTMKSLRDSLPKLTITAPQTLHDEKVGAFSVYSKDVFNYKTNHNFDENNLYCLERRLSLESLNNKGLRNSDEGNMSVCSLDSSITTRSSLESLPKMYDPAVHRHPLLQNKSQRQNDISQPTQQILDSTNRKIPFSCNNDPHQSISTKGKTDCQPNSRTMVKLVFPSPSKHFDSNDFLSFRTLKSTRVNEVIKSHYSSLSSLHTSKLSVQGHASSLHQSTSLSDVRGKMQNAGAHCSKHNTDISVTSTHSTSISQSCSTSSSSSSSTLSSCIPSVFKQPSSSTSLLHPYSLRHHKRPITSRDDNDSGRSSTDPSNEKRICLSSFTPKSQSIVGQVSENCKSDKNSEKRNRQVHLLRPHKRSSSYSVASKMTTNRIEEESKLNSKRHNKHNQHLTNQRNICNDKHNNVINTDNNNNMNTCSSDDASGKCKNGSDNDKMNPKQHLPSRQILTRSQTRHVDQLAAVPLPIIANLEDGLSITELDKLTIENTLINGSRQNIKPSSGNTPMVTTRFHKIKWKEEVLLLQSPTNNRKKTPKVTRILSPRC